MSLRLLLGDCRAVLPTLLEGSVQCVVTSPPYWGLRDYQVAGQIGLEATPEEYVARMVEVFREVRRVLRDDGTVFLNLGDAYASSARPDARGDGTGSTRRPNSTSPDSSDFDLCGECAVALSSRTADTRRLGPEDGQRPSQIGHDGAPADCAGATARSVLLDAPVSTMPQSSPRPLDGCSHCANCGACLAVLRSSSRDGRQCARRAAYTNGNGRSGSDGRTPRMDASGTACLNYKPKDLLGLPWRLAFALQADGWFLRSDIIWAKPNPMPESVTDRPTKAHEYIFLLTKAAQYFYDGDAIREPVQFDARNERWGKGSPGSFTNHEHDDTRGMQQRKPPGFVAMSNPLGRNARTVWTIATEPFDGAHFACFPAELARRCILAGTSAKGACSVCGAPWARIVEYFGSTRREIAKRVGFTGYSEAQPSNPQGLNHAGHRSDVKRSAVVSGWRPTCAHDAAPVPCTVLDPFAGSGTVGEVAERNGRHALLIELSPTYGDLIRERTAQRCLFAQGAEA